MPCLTLSTLKKVPKIVVLFAKVNSIRFTVMAVTSFGKADKPAQHSPIRKIGQHLSVRLTRGVGNRERRHRDLVVTNFVGLVTHLLFISQTQGKI